MIDDFSSACKSLERIKTNCEYLTKSSSCSSATEISKTTQTIELQFQERDLFVILDQWLAEVETKLANSQTHLPSTATIEEGEKLQLQSVQELNKELREISEYIEGLVTNETDDIQSLTNDLDLGGLKKRYYQVLMHIL